MSGLLIAVALIVAGRSQRLRIVLSGAVLVMGIALLLTLSRGAWLGTVAGLCVLAIFLRLRRLAALLGLLAFVFVAIQLAQPGSSTIVSVRLNATAQTDPTLGERQGYYALGEQVLLHYPFGAGWGAAFILGPSGLQADHNPNDWPWYHNDYLQLATQVGIPGLIAFAWIFLYVFRRAVQTSRRVRNRGEFAVIVGLVAALAGMLVQAGTDQFFWRTDIAPHIWILVGLLLAATNLTNSSLETRYKAAEDARLGAGV
jgi:putative inorganic carbon (hco3(-)) transporter